MFLFFSRRKYSFNYIPFVPNQLIAVYATAFLKENRDGTSANFQMLELQTQLQPGT